MEASNKKAKEQEDNKFIPMTSVLSGVGKEVADDVFYYTNQIVNVIMIGNKTDGDWILVDTGMPKCGEEIQKVAEERFGRKPSSIVLTHGHFDHVGGVVHLVKEWDVPVYAHNLEFPFLTGQEAYPEPDPNVENGGMLAKISKLYPIEPINIAKNLKVLPSNGFIPFLPEWKWIHTPGHSPGQVALFRLEDRTLIAADTFTTVKQDSMYRVLVQKKELHGPPNYLTIDWQAAWNSVLDLEKLKPKAVITGHGPDMTGEELSAGLQKLSEEFDEIAIPKDGKYVVPKNK